MSYEGYADLKYTPNENDLIASFFLEPNKVSFEKAASAIAAESSIGTWTDISTLTKEIKEKLMPKVFELDKKAGTAKIAYSIDLFEEGNASQLMSSIGGNIFGMNIVKNVRLADVEFPKSFIRSFKGPRFGIEGIRKIIKVKERPLVGTIIKPKLGLNEQEHAKVAYNAFLGGCDIVKDDENLTDMSFNNFEKRITETLRLRDKCEQETGEKKVYLANVTAPYNEMLRRAKFVKNLGGEYIMIDIITAGWSALQALRNENLDLAIHAHRAGHAAFTRNSKHGISMLVVAKLCRLVGCDQLHIGTAVGKMEGSKKEISAIADALRKKWNKLHSVFPVASGGLHPVLVPEVMKIMGKDIIIQMGGGIHGHPNGTIAGAKAARQAVRAAMDNIPAEQYAKMHNELAAAIKKWKE